MSAPPTQSVSALDRGLHFGDGLFETIACRHGQPRFLSLHLERLAWGCARLGIQPGDLGAIRAEVSKLAASADSSIVKLIVTRGEARTRGYAPADDAQATRIALRYDWPPEDPAKAREGVQAGIASMRLGENSALAGLKHLNRLEQVLAQAELRSRKADELLLFSSSERLISGTMSNVFIVQNGQLKTPRLDRCGVAGVMRHVVLREARRAGIAADECELGAQDLEQAEEIFLTNARIGIWPVHGLESQDLDVGPVTARLLSLIQPLLEEPADA